MTIMAVDNHVGRLSELAASLREAYPGENIIEFTDPLLAVQYSFRGRVDLAFASAPLRGMDADALARGIHQCNREAKVFLVTEGETRESLRDGDDVSGILGRPVTATAIAKLKESCAG